MITKTNLFYYFAFTWLNFIITQDYVNIDNNEKQCQKLLENPYFRSSEALKQKVWRIYRSWHSNHKTCENVIFEEATSQIVSTVEKRMSPFLKTEPLWPAAEFLVTMNYTVGRVLLIPTMQEGLYTGVNYLYNYSIDPAPHEIPLLNMSMKMFKNMKYLVLSYCELYLTILTTPADANVNQTEINRIVELLDLGEGYVNCDKNYTPPTPETTEFLNVTPPDQSTTTTTQSTSTNVANITTTTKKALPPVSDITQRIWYPQK